MQTDAFLVGERVLAFSPTALTMSFGLLAEEPEKDQKPEVAQEEPLLDEKASAEASCNRFSNCEPRSRSVIRATRPWQGKESPAPAASTNGHTAELDAGGAGPAGRAIPQENQSQGRTGPVDQRRRILRRIHLDLVGDRRPRAGSRSSTISRTTSGRDRSTPCCKVRLRPQLGTLLE